MTGRQIVAGAGYSTTDKLKLNYILVMANADNINVSIKDSTGITVWEVKSGVTGKRFFPSGSLNGHEVNGLTVTSFDNCSSILIGVDRVTE